MKIILSYFLLFATFLSAETIGKIIAHKGTSLIMRGNKVIYGQRGAKVQEGDFVRTSSQSKVTIKFKDKTSISVGMNSELKIDEYIFSGKRSAALFDMKGAFRTLTGKIGKINPNKFNIKTKTATIGIRGTLFYFDTNDMNRVACLDGAIKNSPEEEEAFIVKKGYVSDFEEDAHRDSVEEYTVKEIMQLGKLIGLSKDQILKDLQMGKSQRKKRVNNSYQADKNSHKQGQKYRDNWKEKYYKNNQSFRGKLDKTILTDKTYQDLILGHTKNQ